MKHSTGALVAVCAAGLVCFPAQAGTIFSIDPSTISAAPGDVGDAFDVVLTNNGPDGISVAAFTFEVSVTDPDITFMGADFSTIAYPYIFAGDSFDEDLSSPLSLDSFPVQTLDASDLTFDGAGVTLTAGESLALGDVQFDVADDAATGPFTVSFTCGATAPVQDCNSLSDALGNSISVDTLNNGDINIAALGTTPEPASWLLLAGGLAALTSRRVRHRLSASGPRSISD